MIIKNKIRIRYDKSFQIQSETKNLFFVDIYNNKK